MQQYIRRILIMRQYIRRVLIMRQYIRRVLIMCQYIRRVIIISLFTWSKQKWLFWRASFYPANQSNLKRIQKVLIGWKKPALQKSHFCFDHVNRPNVCFRQWAKSKRKSNINALPLIPVSKLAMNCIRDSGSTTLDRKHVWSKTY